MPNCPDLSDKDGKYQVEMCMRCCCCGRRCCVVVFVVVVVLGVVVVLVVVGGGGGVVGLFAGLFSLFVVFG